MHYSENYHLNKPDLADQYNLSHWNENTDAIDSAMQNIRNGMDAIMKATLLNFCYPIGSIYWSSNSTNPHDLFGGTWVQIKDKFVWAKGDEDDVNDTGGEKTHTLTINEMPSHNHTLNGNTNSDPSSPTAKFIGLPSTTGDMSTNSTGQFGIRRKNGDEYLINSSSGNIQATHDGRLGTGWSIGDGSYADNMDLQSVYLNVEHTHTVTVNGYLTGTTDNTGSNTAHNNMPPYVVKYCWERTA